VLSFYDYLKGEILSEYEEMWEKLGLNLSRHDELLASIGEAHEKTIASQSNRPEAMAYFDEAVAVAHCRRAKELLDSKDKGQKIMGTFCIYVPDEIAIAAGVTPVALCGGTPFSIQYAETLFPRDICPLIKSTFGLTLGKMCPYLSITDIAVGETTCDGKKKAWEILGTMWPTHVMEVPQKKEQIDRQLWLAEVALFKNKMEQLSGKKITFDSLLKGVKIINRRREVLAKLHGFRKELTLPISGKDVLLVTQVALFDDPERFVSKVEALNEELEKRVKSKIGVFEGKTKRIMVAGCPAVVANWKIHHLIETSGAAVVCDETCTGFRYYANLVDDKAMDVNELIRNVADRYLNIDCSCFTPNKERVKNVMDLVKEYHVDGVIQYVLQYCHGYNIEAVKLEQALKEARIPVLKLETDYSEEDIGPLKTRIEAFMERLG
jgi:benzoyl-CoA reductase/2-hydroxyglutaryl-CoA dehydratase subunit BcrC/BadD/HgdB